MMEAISKIEKYVYRGFEFSTLDEALKFKERFEEAEKIVNLLKPRPKRDNCDFENGHGYIQHDSISLTNFKEKFSELLLKKYGKTEDDISRINKAVSKLAWSWIGRFYDDNDPILVPILHRVGCIDEYGREFGQVYFRYNPHTANLFEIKD